MHHNSNCTWHFLWASPASQDGDVLLEQVALARLVGVHLGSIGVINE